LLATIPPFRGRRSRGANERTIGHSSRDDTINRHTSLRSAEHCVPVARIMEQRHSLRRRVFMTRLIGHSTANLCAAEFGQRSAGFHASTVWAYCRLPWPPHSFWSPSGPTARLHAAGATRMADGSQKVRLTATQELPRHEGASQRKFAG